LLAIVVGLGLVLALAWRPPPDTAPQAEVAK
jgi:hypothetical protein